jgi:hypothetical protein
MRPGHPLRLTRKEVALFTCFLVVLSGLAVAWNAAVRNQGGASYLGLLINATRDLPRSEISKEETAAWQEAFTTYLKAHPFPISDKQAQLNPASFLKIPTAQAAGSSACLSLSPQSIQDKLYDYYATAYRIPVDEKSGCQMSSAFDISVKVEFSTYQMRAAKDPAQPTYHAIHVVGKQLVKKHYRNPKDCSESDVPVIQLIDMTFWYGPNNEPLDTAIPDRADLDLVNSCLSPLSFATKATNSAFNCPCTPKSQLLK